jgi:PAS domain-containing protein
MMTAHLAPSPALRAAPALRPGLVADDSRRDVPALTLDRYGMIRDCNLAGETLFKYSREEILGRHVSVLLPQLISLPPMHNGQPNAHLRFLCRIGRRFQAVDRDGAHFASELFLNLLDDKGYGRLSLLVRPSAEAPESP